MFLKALDIQSTAKNNNKAKKMTNNKKEKAEKYQWAIYYQALTRSELEALIPAMEFYIANGINVARYSGYLAYIKQLLNKKNYRKV